MRKVMVQELVSVDGFAAGPNDELDFFETVSDYSEVDHDNIGILQDVDTIVLGARSYRMFVDYWPTAQEYDPHRATEAGAQPEPVARLVNTIPKLVFSSTLDSAPWGRWDPAQVARGEAVDEIDKLRREPGAGIIVWGSLSIVQALLRAGLVDVVQLRVLPIALGRGRPLFPDDAGALGLRLVEAKPYRSGILSLTYHPDR